MYLGTEDGEVMTQMAIARNGGGLFNFYKADIVSYPPAPPYDQAFEIYIQGFKGGLAVTDKVAHTTLIHGLGALADIAKFDVSSDPKFQGIDKLVITSGYPTDYVAIDNVSVESVNVTPVKIKQFWGDLKRGIATINWESGIESNFNHYELQRSLMH